MINPESLTADDRAKVDRIRIGDYTGRLLSTYNTPAVVATLRRLFTDGWSLDTVVARSEDRDVHCSVIDQDEVVYLKRVYVAGVKSLLRTAVGVNKAQKAWRIGRWLRKRGVDTPLPVALFKRRTAHFSLEFVCVTKGLADAVDLHNAVLQVQGKQPLQQQKKRRLIVAVAKFVARLHGNSVYHGDFSADNILVRGNGDTQEMRVYLIDLDAVRSSCWISERRRVKNLEELGRNFLDLRTISTADRVRFLKVYAAHCPCNQDSLRQLFRKVQQRTEERLAHFGQSFNR